MSINKDEWYEEQFEEISRNINSVDFLDYFYFLRIRNYKLNNISIARPNEIMDVTKKAFSDPKNAIEILVKPGLNGVGIPVASAIMAMRIPEDFAIIDKNVLAGIAEEKKEFFGLNKTDYESDSFWAKNKEKRNIELYKKYIEFLKKEKTKNQSLRDLEKHYFLSGRVILKNERRLKKDKKINKSRK